MVECLLTYNHFHILTLFDVLPNFLFTTSETMRDYYLYTRYELSCKFPNNLGPKILGDYEISEKSQNSIE